MRKFFSKVNNYSRFGAPAQAKMLKIYPYFKVITSEQGPRVTMDENEVLMLGSNNYLGMTTHPAVRQAAIEAIEYYGVGTTGSRFLNGNMAPHVELEQKLAEFIGTEEVVIFPSGMQANLGGISSVLSKKNEWVLSDEQNHASIIDGIKLGNPDSSHTLVYKHNDMEDLEAKLKKVPKGKALITTDGIFSMEGDIAHLDQIVDLAEDRDAGVYVDDAHSMGVLGDHGRGTANHFNLTDKVEITMGTFSKSFATVGGFVATNAKIANWIRHHARSFIFSASMPPANCATALKVLEIIEQDDSYQKNLLRMADRMRTGLIDLGFELGGQNTPIIPIIIGKKNLTFKFYKQLFGNKPVGIFANPIVPPATAPKRDLIRTSYIATMDESIIDEGLAIFESVGKKMKII